MELMDNIHKTFAEDLRSTLTTGSRMSIAASCFSIYAYQELRKELEHIEELRFIFTSPTFIADKTNKEQREFYIPRLNRERSLTGNEFEILLRNELTQKAIVRECAEWIRRKVKFKSNKTKENMMGFGVVDSQGIEKRFAEQLEQQEAVEVYTKLPRGFYINTPVGKYNPDWAIVFREGEVKHIYFVAETKGSEDITQLRAIEYAKIECASRHFASISDSQIKFGVVKNYETLYNKVMQD